ncbi:MAG: hypothetical protein ACOVPB_12855 [Bacteroidia bacterium]
MRITNKAQQSLTYINLIKPSHDRNKTIPITLPILFHTFIRCNCSDILDYQ